MVNMLCSPAGNPPDFTGAMGRTPKILLWFLLGLQLVGFGNKEFLLREFSKRLTDIIHLWAKFSSVESFAHVLRAIVVFSSFDSSIRIILAAWFVVRFLYSSFDALVFISKKFSYRDVELFGFIAFCILLYLRSDSSGFTWLLSTFLTLDILKTFVLVSAFSRSWRESKAVLMNFSFTKELFFPLSISGILARELTCIWYLYILTKYKLLNTVSCLISWFIYRVLSNFIFNHL